MSDEHEDKPTPAKHLHSPNKSRRPDSGSDSAKSKGNFAILNTPFAIFVASSIVLPFLIWSFTFWEDHYLKQRKRAEIIQRLDIEVTSRLSRNWCTLVLDDDLEAFTRGLDGATSAFPEFQNWSMIALLFYLEKQISEKDGAEVRGARSALQNPVDGMKNLEEALLITRWQPELMRQRAQKCTGSNR